MTRLSTQKVLEENQNRQSSSITSLKLNQKALSDVSCLSDFKNLEKLDLAFNNLTSLEGLSLCINLKWLSVVQNKLQSLKGIEGLSKLTVLNAGKNKIRSMTEVSNLITLRALILNDNEISSICKLDQLKELNTLVLSRNPIREIGHSLVKVKSITKLSLSNCQLQNIGSSFTSLIDLKEVRLAHNEITTIPVELARNTRLQNLDMGNNFISNWSDLKVLSSLHSLRNLNLQGNPIAEKDKLAKKVKKLIPNLQIYNGRPIERGRENEINSKKNVQGQKADDSPSKGSDQKDMKEVRRENPSNEKTSRKCISSPNEDGPLDKDADSDIGREELKRKKSKTNKLPKKDVASGNKDDDVELESRSNRKNAKKIGENKLDMIDDGETSFMDLIISSNTENTRDGNKEKMGVEAVRDRKPVGDAAVTFPVKKKKSKSVKMGSAALQLLSSTTDVGLGGPSSWDA